MDGGHSSVPVGLVRDEVLPEGSGAELGRDNDRAPGKKRGKEPGEEAVDVEKRHDEHGTISRAQLICCLNVLCQLLATENLSMADLHTHSPCQIPVCQGYLRHVSHCHTLCFTTTYSFRSTSGPAGM